MNLQERLERILGERRSYVEGHEPGPDAAMRGLLSTCAEGALHAENPHERDGWLVRLAGLCLYVLHPEDVSTSEDERHPGLPSQAAVSPPDQQVGVRVSRVDDVVYQRSGGTYRRKPRPDRG